MVFKLDNANATASGIATRGNNHGLRRARCSKDANRLEVFNVLSLSSAPLQPPARLARGHVMVPVA
jgi:hypothetical protein